ncbi:glycoside hydrolase family 13 protein [Athelia psychrophila]|uniref:alpha-amylase n=1 Tax=Athelia psychrophila TaxID=1759441 RepID=A0A167TZK9_9AGAM|nr:glycoside hydrolase family 13 protein [Fibularhizoctonia sp. CBS 109695]
MSLAENVIAFTLLFDGIPIIYSGQEHHLDGGVSPLDREAIWLTGYDTSATLYKVIAQLNAIRKFAISQDSNGSYVVYQAIVNYYDSNNIVIRKGYTGHQIVAVYNNFGSGKAEYTLSLTGTQYDASSTVMEVLSCTEVTVGNDGALTATVKTGLPLVYYPLSALSGSGICGQ